LIDSGFWGISNTIPCLTGHSDYPNFTKKEKRYIDDPERHARFTRFNHGQITESGNLKRMD